MYIYSSLNIDLNIDLQKLIAVALNIKHSQKKVYDVNAMLNEKVGKQDFNVIPRKKKYI